jgi:MFS family permease
MAGKTSDRVGSRWLMAGGMTLVAISLLLFAQLQPDSTYWALLPGMVLGGVGMAITMTPMTAAALSAVPVNKAGVGSGMLNTFRQVGGSLGIAVMGAILAAEASSSIASGASTTTAFVNGLHHALYTAAVIAFVAAIVAGTLIRSHAGPTRASAEAEGAPMPEGA